MGTNWLKRSKLPNPAAAAKYLPLGWPDIDIGDAKILDNGKRIGPIGAVVQCLNRINARWKFSGRVMIGIGGSICITAPLAFMILPTDYCWNAGQAAHPPLLVVVGDALCCRFRHHILLRGSHARIACDL